MYAVVEIKGKQYRAEKGASLKVDKIDAEQGQSLPLDTVLLLAEGDKVTVGNPFVKGASVKVSVESHGKHDKVVIYKHKAKKDYRRKQGHREQYTLIKVEDILGA